MTTPRVPLAETDVDDHERVTHNGELFTGVATETGPDGTLRAETRYTHGILNGPARAFWPDQTLRLESVYEGGFPVLHREWHRNGRLALERHLRGGGELVSEQRWDEDGNPVSRP
ncbi:toxin-antitoxin system YwqK family antitoxin [Nonomuraea sp. KM90]|uniref:toxin-antitoxin system YwqK family antitoxin n=1 Tax=Nonomuraea sp. KM90 TaxID=3457428 RepID=UPI003FCC71CD